MEAQNKNGELALQPGHDGAAPYGAQHEQRAALVQVVEILESISDSFYAVDAAWNITYLNQHAARLALPLLQLKPDAVIGRNLWELLSHLVDTAFYRISMQVMAERRRADFEWFSPMLQQWLEFNVCPSASGGVSVFFNDITERRRSGEAVKLLAEAGAALASSLDYQTTLSQLSRLLVPTLADCCIIDLIDASGAPQRVEVAFADPSRTALADVIRGNVGDDWRGPHAEAIRRGDSVLISDCDTTPQPDAPSQTEHLAGVRSMIMVPLCVREQTIGAIRLCAFESTRRYDTRDLELAEDLARRAATAVDNARLYRDARAGLEARDAFLSIASHELKTPLTSLLGYAYVLEKADRDTPEGAERARRAVDVIKRQSRRLNELIDNMLDLSRLQQGQFSIERRAIDLAPLLRRAVDEQRITASNHRIELSGADKPLPIMGDEARLEQVFHNLLGNAIKYSPRGGAVRVAVSSDATHAHVAVSDNGIGIPQAAKARLFTPFYRANNVGDGTSGFGIGLYIVKQIIDLHDGMVSFSSQEGIGSTFVVMLPLGTML